MFLSVENISLENGVSKSYRSLHIFFMIRDLEPPFTMSHIWFGHTKQIFQSPWVEATSKFCVFITLWIFIHSVCFGPYLKGKQKQRSRRHSSECHWHHSFINENNSRRPWRSNLGLNWLATTKVRYQIRRGRTQLKHWLWLHQPHLDPLDL